MEELDKDDRIDVRDEASLERWAKRLKVSKEELRKVAERVGPKVGDIRQNLVGGFNPKAD